MFRHIIGAALLLALPASALTQASAQAPAQVTLEVDTAKPGAPISRYIYGHFAEHLGRGIYEGIWVGEDSKIPNIRGYRTDVVNALKKIHVPVVRWPGGCFADLYDWRDGIGPRAKRPTRINVHWGGVTDDNRFGTHEFMDFAELIGADAYVSGNVGSLSPYDMNQWVEYITSDEKASLAEERRRNGRDKPWNLKFFGIGNETWGCGGNMRPEYAADINARYSTFVNAPKAMGMVKVASGSTGNVTWDHKTFTEAMMEFGGKMDALSFHYYAMPTGRARGPATGFSEEKWADELELALRMESLIAETKQVMDKYDPQKKVALYVDEWGSWYDPEPGSTPGFLYQQNTLRDVHVAALTLNIFHRHTDRVKMANIAQMINVLQAMILTDKEKMVLTPTYHVFDMYQVFMGAVPYPTTVSGRDYVQGDSHMPMLDVFAARGKDGKLYLARVNTDPHRSARVATGLEGRARGLILTGPAMDTHNTFDRPDTIKPMPFTAGNGGRLTIDLPSKALVVVAVE